MSSSFRSTTHPFPGDVGLLLASQGALGSPAPATNPSSPALEREEPLEGAPEAAEEGVGAHRHGDRFCCRFGIQVPWEKPDLFFFTLILDSVTGFEQK